MNKFFLACILLFLCILSIFGWRFIHAEPKYPADISYLVADLKYNKKDGIKICEVQHGSLSAMDGDVYVSGGDGNISPKIADYFTHFPAKKWTVGLIYPPLQRSLAAKGWNIDHSMKTLLKDPTFLKTAVLTPEDPFAINSYAGMVFADYDIVRNINRYREDYPGILFINAATFPYWMDKYKMNALFDNNDKLKPYKADWKLYPKKYDMNLAEKIQKEMPSEFYVIKPRGQGRASGVIVVSNSDLDSVLKMILEPSDSLKKHSDTKYSYWFNTKDKTFLIEKYYKSDYLSFPSPLDQKISSETEYHYDPTMRLVFIVQSDEGKLTYHGLGGFWKLPCKALEEEATLNESSISCNKAPFYTAVDPELLKEVNAKMEKAMLLLYEIMLNDKSSESENN